MTGSVRTRLTLGVSLLVGLITLAAALIAPSAVRHSLIDDRIDAQRDLETAELAASPPLLDTSQVGPRELTALFGPDVAQLVAQLDAIDALGPLRDADPDGTLYVLADRNVLATVPMSGPIKVQALTEAPPVAMVSRQRLVRLAADYGVETAPSFPQLVDATTTFEAFLEELAGRITVDLGEYLDPEVFDGYRVEGRLTIPRDVWEALRGELDAAAAPQVATAAAAPEGIVVETREVGGTPMLVTAATDGIDNSVRRVRVLLWLAVPVVMVAAGILTWMLAGRSLRPVAAITARTREIRSSTLHERVPVPRADDEIAALANEMNTMLDRVQREDERRRQFVSDASHELRSPIATIRAQAEAALLDDHQHELAEGVLAEAERMSALVDDLLALARHDEQLPAPRSIVDLDDIVYSEAARTRRVPVDVRNVSAGQVRARADELTRVVVHLLDNAARHASSKVEVTLTADEKAVTLTVDDDGVGIPVDERERVFERFVRLDDARDRDAGGAGLGLAVVATVVQASGGSIVAEGSPLGGARLRATFPPADR
jgi:signal transduction histidine kinase